jgi:hypothetical protein
MGHLGVTGIALPLPAYRTARRQMSEDPDSIIHDRKNLKSRDIF